MHLGQASLALEASPEDPTGTWAQLQTTTTETNAGIAGTITTTNHRVLLLTASPTPDGQLQFTGGVCDAWVETSSSVASTELPAAFVDALPPVELLATLQRSGEEFWIVFEPSTEQIGASVGAGEPLPGRFDAPGVEDTDGDGNPGVTIRVTGIGGGEMYFAQRTLRELHLTRYDGTVLDGEIRWTAERVVFGATSRPLRNAREAVPTIDPTQNFFRTTRVPDDTTCDEILGASEALFAR